VLLLDKNEPNQNSSVLNEKKKKTDTISARLAHFSTGTNFKGHISKKATSIYEM
jgi:hypothetical protein